ncbi:MAG: peptidase E, partial [Candidatus Roizmanbacteria bacterium]|nr:peptidase E [Candidatus Roizmanbacteria bacterium]
VKFHIQPHLNSKLFTSIRLEHIEKHAKVLEESVYAIDDNSAIQVIDSKISVVSEGVWKKFN